MTQPPAHRALLLTGARQVGKTTLFLQTVSRSLGRRAAGQDSLCHVRSSIAQAGGLDGLLKLWRELEPEHEGVEYLFLDEIQYTKDWQTWLKHQVDFQNRRIAVTGSATPLVEEGQESGVGRWHTVRLATLSFYEYLQIKTRRASHPSAGIAGQLVQLARNRFPAGRRMRYPWLAISTSISCAAVFRKAP